MKTAAEKIEALRALMDKDGLDGFIIPKADEYQGEFVPPSAERLKWLTGFTGSAGVAVILADKACALTDGRYALQIMDQVDREVFEVGDVVEMGAHRWLKENAKPGAVIGYDPWLHTPDQIAKIAEEAPEISLSPVGKNPVDEIWADRPAPPKNPVEIFPAEIAGLSREEKKAKIAAIVREQGAHAAILTLPDSICWLLNVRGSDIDNAPTVLSYAIVYADESKPVGWIAGDRQINGDLGGDVEIVPLQAVLDLKNAAVMIDEKRSPAWFKTTLEQQGATIINAKDPCIDIKAIKTTAEIAAIRRAHIIDGAALCKFFYWLETQSGHTEWELGEKLHEFRARHSAFRKDSFPPICGFASNGAIVHYRAEKETAKKVEGDSLLLLDSGGQYCEGDVAGTTDITRTVAIGQPSEEMRNRFSLVLKGHIALASAVFSKEATGKDIDALARQPLWDQELDYAHGTGHGVGCYLAVHEEATGISTRSKETFKAGMLISNEPGYYKTGEYGIRTENLVFVKEADDENFEFETISLTPIDRKLIIKDMLSEDELNWLNAYHAQTYAALKGLLDADEAAWLKQQTKPL